MIGHLEWLSSPAAMKKEGNLQRKQVEKLIVDRRQSDPRSFLAETFTIFFGTFSIQIRQLAFTLLRRSLPLKFAETQPAIWYALDKSERTLVKDQLLSNLLAPEKQIKKAAAELVATICVLQLPVNEWPDIIQKMTSNTKHENIDVCLSAILTLGFICQQLKLNSQSVSISNEQAQSILTGILLAIENSNSQIRESALLALENSIEFMKPFMIEQRIRQVTLERILKINNATENDTEIVLRILAEFVRVNYEVVQDCLIPIFSFTNTFISNPKNEQLCKLSMEVWRTLASEYKQLIERKKQVTNYLESGDALTLLTKNILNNLEYNNADEQEDDQNSVKFAAYRTLCELVEIGQEKYAQQIFKYVEMAVSQESWSKKSAGVLAYSAFLFFNKADVVERMINSTIEGLIGLLNDPNEKVQLNTAFCLSTISERVANCYTKHPRFADILNILGLNLAKKQTISHEILKVLTNLAQYQKEQPSRVLQQQAANMIRFLIANALRQDISKKGADLKEDISLADKSFVAAMAFFNNCSTVELCDHYIETIVRDYPQSYSFPGSDEKKSIIQNGFLTLLHSCLMAKEQKKSPISQQAILSIFNLVKEHFRKLNNVTADGIYVLGSLCCFTPTVEYIREVKPYVLAALQKKNQATIFKAALGCLVDLFRNSPMSFRQPDLINFVGFLVNLAKDDISKELRLSVLICISDMFIYLRETGITVDYIQNLMETVFKGFITFFQIIKTDEEYAEELQQTLIDTVTCVIHTLAAQNNSITVFKQFAAGIVDFVEKCMSIGRNNTVKFVDSGLMLVVDLIDLYSDKNTIRRPFIDQMISQLEKKNAKGGKYAQTLAFVRQVIKKVNSKN